MDERASTKATTTINRNPDPREAPSAKRHQRRVQPWQSRSVTIIEQPEEPEDNL
jgi:hypothetical protein